MILFLLRGLLIASLLFSSSFVLAFKKGPSRLDCQKMPCSKVLPGAVKFTRAPKAHFAVGLDKSGKVVGWIGLSVEVVKVPAYSGQPLITLVGLNKKGIISGVKVLHHSEPILLVGIPEKVLHDFSAFYVGKKATSRIVVGTATGKAVSVDVISGATVTALAQNKTILETARSIGLAVGVITVADTTPGHFVKDKMLWSWDKMYQNNVFGRLTVTEKQMGISKPEGNFIDLWYTIADAPHIGLSLLGKHVYAHLKKQCKPGEHLFIVLGNGSSSFKGSAFVRGGIFDRIRIEQGLREVLFRDTDYYNLSRLRAKGSPEFKEAAVFITRGAPVDPGARYRMIFLGSRYDGIGGFHRTFLEFKSNHRLPSSVYHLDGPDPEAGMYVQAWINHRGDSIFLIVFFLLVMGLFTARKFSFTNLRRLRFLHVSVMLVSVVVLGFILRAQPSITQILTLFEAFVREWRWGLFLSEPLLFISWIFIAIVSIIWGRGVFCGWVCPYGSLSELLYKVGRFVKLPSFDLPDRIHKFARYLRYVVFFVLVPIFLASPILGEKMAEIEPFKSTFFVYAWNRPFGFFTWWVLLLALSLVWFRPFCRYICPLGGALALFGSFRISGPKRRSFCESCTICTKGCEPFAIRENGTIDPRECLSCMECEANYATDTVCPPLIGISKILEKAEQTEKDKERLAKLLEQKKDV